MPVIISEVAIQADGTYAIEIMNTNLAGQDAIDISDWSIGLLSVEPRGLVPQFSDLGLPPTILPGQIITFGHSSIEGLDYTSVATDTSFANPDLTVVVLYDPSPIPIPEGYQFKDSAGHIFSDPFGTDVVWSSHLGRPVDPDPWERTNIDDFDVTSPFSSNNLGSFACFCAGTIIASENGPIAVEGLLAGTGIITLDGRTVPVLWVGRQTIATRFAPAERLMPVRFAADSLGDGVPQAALTVTTDHAILVDGVLCQAGALVNNTTITRVPLSELGKTFTVYHVETEKHEVILANGTPTETFFDNGARTQFDNFADFDKVYGTDRAMQEMPLPRAMSARQIPIRIRKKLSAKTAA